MKKTKTSIIPTIIIFILSIVLLSACGSNESQKNSQSEGNNSGSTQKGVLRFAYQKLPLMLALKESNVLDEALKPYGFTVEWFEFSTGAAMLEAFNAGNVDMGINGLAALYGVDKGIDFKGVGGFVFNKNEEGILVRKDSSIQSISDLKGKKVAYSQASVAQHLLTLLLEKNGMTLDDIETVNLLPAEGNLTLAKGDVDAWVTWNPFFTVASHDPNYRVLETANDSVDYANLYIASSRFAQEHPDVVQATTGVLKDTWASIVKDPGPTAKIISDATNIAPEIWEEIIRNEDTPWLNMNEGLTESLQRTADQYFDMGLVSKKLNLAEREWVPTTTK